MIILLKNVRKISSYLYSNKIYINKKSICEIYNSNLGQIRRFLIFWYYDVVQLQMFTNLTNYGKLVNRAVKLTLLYLLCLTL